MKNIDFKRILSEDTHYGIIWDGYYNNKKCVIKVILLDTGVHYNRYENEYYKGSRKISDSKASKYFNRDCRHGPYLHTKYKTRKAMSIDNFNHEILMIKTVSKLKLAPKLYMSWIEHKYKIHYGIIVMEKLDCTVKDIILKRVIKKDELNFVMSKIRLLHKYGIKHGDMKPSNVGVKCDKNGYISKVKIIDWGKGDYCNDEDLFERDILTFHNHIDKNILERKNKNK